MSAVPIGVAIGLCLRFRLEALSHAGCDLCHSEAGRKSLQRSTMNSACINQGIRRSTDRETEFLVHLTSCPSGSRSSFSWLAS
jgi:hypothetical protein